MRRFLRGFSLGVVVKSVLAALAQAQTLQAPPAASAIKQRQRAALAGHLRDEFGSTCCAILQIPAAAFQPIGSWGSWSNNGYFYASGLTTAIAPVQLPSGAVIVFLDLYYDDADPTADASAVLYQYPGYTTGAPTMLSSVSSSGFSGAGYAFSAPFSHTVDNNPSTGGGQYSVVMTLAQSFSNLGFKGVDLWYYRQVSPAPGVATFQDVPTNDPYFQFIEALAASGITAGCNASPPQYCPDRDITRGEMAVYRPRPSASSGSTELRRDAQASGPSEARRGVREIRAIMRPAPAPSRRQLAKPSPPHFVHAGWTAMEERGTPDAASWATLTARRSSRYPLPQPARTKSPANCAATSPPTS
jgi:hypothetical protein